MGVYRVLFRESVFMDLRVIPKVDLEMIMEEISALARNPRPSGAEKLTEQDRYRIRQGDYRVVYSIEDESLRVCVVKVGRRSSIYR